jgi:hypothetical protein
MRGRNQWHPLAPAPPLSAHTYAVCTAPPFTSPPMVALRVAGVPTTPATTAFLVCYRSSRGWGLEVRGWRREHTHPLAPVELPQANVYCIHSDYNKPCNPLDYHCSIPASNPYVSAGISVALPKFLSQQRIAQIIPPLATIVEQLWTTPGEFALILYPFVESKSAFEAKLSDSRPMAGRDTQISRQLLPGCASLAS